MATTVTAKISASMSANWSKSLALGNVQATPSLSVSQQFTNGTGASKVEQVAQASGSISASGSADIDLAGALSDPGGDTITFTKVKGFLIKNTSASGDGISVGGTFASWLKAAGDEVEVMPGGALLLMNPTADGYAVTPTTGDTMTLTNLDSVNAQTYEVEVIGETS